MDVSSILGAVVGVFILGAFPVWLVIDYYNSEYEGEVIKYYTIDQDEDAYTITLWVAEVFRWKNKCKKKPVEIECTRSASKSYIDEVEEKYNSMGIYTMLRTYGAEKCLL